MRMKENIKNLVGQLEDRKAFVELVAAEFDRKPSTISTHWFAGFWSVPLEFEGRVVELLQNAIRQQIENAKEIA